MVALKRASNAFREVVITAKPAHASSGHLESIIREQLKGTFFTLNLDRAGDALMQAPWVQRIALRRQWPRRLEIDVVEHAPLARWNDSALVDAHGEVFSADWDGDLPQFNGPEGEAATVAARYREWSALLAPLGLTIRTLTLSPRGGWEIGATDMQSPLTIELGRDDPGGRLARFIAAHDRTIAVLARAGRRIDQVDLRYRNGFAVRVPGFREKPVRKS